jgi:hypothetical protein
MPAFGKVLFWGLLCSSSLHGALGKKDDQKPISEEELERFKAACPDYKHYAASAQYEILFLNFL